MADFENFSPLHYLCLVVCVVITIIAGILAKRWRGTENGKRLRLFIGFGCLVIWIINVGYGLLFLPFDWGTSLPLQFCNLANLIGAVAVFRHGRLLKSVIYFWAFSLCIWAFITPVLWKGPASAEFWIFWAYHVFIPLAVVEIFIVERFRPNWRDFRNAVLFTIAYMGILVVLNNRFGWNYGYVGPSKPSVATLIDFLGPYPLRLLWMVLIGTFLFFLLLLPWLRRGGDVAEESKS